VTVRDRTAAAQQLLHSDTQHLIPEHVCIIHQAFTVLHENNIVQVAVAIMMTTIIMFTTVALQRNHSVLYSPC